MLPIECIVRGYLVGSAWKEYRASGTMHGEPLPAGLLRVDAAARAGVHPVDQGRRSGATTRTSPSTRRSTLVGAELAERAATSSLGRVRPGRGPGRRGGASSSPTPSSSSAASTASWSLADEVLTPDSSRFWPADAAGAGHDAAVVRQAAGARLARGASGWDKQPPAAAVARRGRRRHRRRATSRPTSASRDDRSPTGPAHGRRQDAACRHDDVTFSVLVEVRLRPGIADPQGATIERALPTLGFDGVSGVRVGKAIRFTIEAADEATAPRPRSTTCASGSSPTR